MRRKRYNFTLKIETTFLAYPNTETKEHDKLAKAIINSIEEKLDIPFVSFRDCKTGRFRKL
jgi:hypothetical protein